MNIDDGGRGADRGPQSPAPTVKPEDFGISKSQSSDWQKLADVPEEEFEEVLAKPGVPSTPPRPKRSSFNLAGRVVGLLIASTNP